MALDSSLTLVVDNSRALSCKISKMKAGENESSMVVPVGGSEKKQNMKDAILVCGVLFVQRGGRSPLRIYMI